MANFRRPLVFVLLAGLAGAGAVAVRAETPAMAVAGAPILATPAGGPGDDPFPIARVRVSDAQLADALKTFDPGSLVRMPRDDFEARVRSASVAATAARTAPRIVEAKYAAALAGSNLSGEAEWVVVNPRPRPAFLPLDPLRIAIRDGRWGDGREAVVGAFGAGFPAGPGVWVPEAGRHVMKAKWSAAGTGAASDRRFELRVPPAPSAVLDLDLPADRTPVVAADLLLSGPVPVPDDAGRRSWRVRFGERSRVEFGVRGPGDAAAGPAVASLVAQYDLAPGQVACTFEYDLRPARGAASVWAFALPPGVQVTDVVAADRAGWRVDPVVRELRVALRQPSGGGKVRISAVAPLPPRGKAAPLPVVRPVGAVVADERLDVRVGPALELESWDAGDYRLTESAVAPDGARTLRLVGSLRPAAGDDVFRRPPAVRVAGSETDFSTDEAVEWRVEGGRTHLAARVKVRVVRGALFRIAVRTPPGFTPDPPTSMPEDTIAFAGPATPPATGLAVEFVRPVEGGQTVELRFALRGPILPAGGTVRLPFPAFGPTDATERRGWVSFAAGSGWAVAPRPSPGAAELVAADAPEPPPPADAEATYPYRGREPDGELILTAVRPEFTAALDTRLDLAGGRLAAATTIRVAVAAGVVSAVTVFEPGPVNAGRTWKVADGSNAIATVTPVRLGGLPGALPLLARPWGGLAPAVGARAAAAGEAGTYWVVRFARPVEDGVTLETAAAVGPPVTPDGGRLLADDWAAGRRVFLAVRGAVGPTARFDRPAVLGGGVAEPPAGTPGAVGWSFSGLYHVTLCSDTEHRVVFGGTAAGRGGAILPIRLANGVQVQDVNADGHRLDPGRCRLWEGDGGPELRLPLPAGNSPVRFEIRYRLPPSGGGAFARVSSPLPGLPDGAGDIRRWWAFTPGVLAAWPLGARGGETTDDPPQMLSDPPDRMAGDLIVGRYAGESVVVVPGRVAAATGYGLAAVVALLGWVGARRANRTVGFALLASVAAAGVAVWLGPAAWVQAAFPVVAVGLPALGGVVIARGRRAVSTRPPAAIRPVVTARAAVATLVLLGTTAVLPTHAQPPAREVVFLLAGPADAPGREVALVPRDLLDRLDALARPSEPGAVVTRAEYVGRVEDGFARFTARYVVQSFRDGGTTVALPLADVRLEGVAVGGKAANPTAVRPDLYAVAVPGRGRHEVEVRFAVPVATTGPEREVRFGVPEVPDSQLEFTAPSAARQAQAVGRVGRQGTTTAAAAVRLDADLGGVKTVQVRWRQGAGGAAVVTVREGCVWDVAEAGSTLTACYLVRVDSGSATGFRFDLPKELEPTRVEVRPLDPAPGPGAALRDWAVAAEKGGARQVRVDLAGPTDGRLLVVLECVLRGAPSRQPVLHFPRPVGMDRRGGVYGLRARGVAVEGVGRSGVIDFAADALAREFGAYLRLDPAVPILAFAPRASETAVLRPTLRAGPDPATATQDVTWRVGPHRADGEGVIRWTAKEPLALVEFALPGKVLEVRGADVAGWAQADGRVQAWLRKPAADGAVEWVAAVVPAPPGKPPPDPFTFDAPAASLLNLRTTEQVVRVRVADGWAGRVERDRGWKPDPAGKARGWTFRADGDPPPVRLEFFATRAGVADGFGLVEGGGPATTYRATVELAVPPARPHHLVLRVAGLPAGASVALDLPPGTIAAVRSSDLTEREWDLDVAASPAGVFRAGVVIRLPATGRLPTIWCGAGGAVSAAGGVVRWVGLAGASGAKLYGATPASVAERNAVRVRWPGEAERVRRTGGTVWAVGDTAPSLATGAGPAAPLKPAPPRPTPAVPADATPPPQPASRLPWLTATGWCAAVLGVGVLFARFPRATWPEQVGGLGALFGFAVAGGVAVGVAGVVVARVVWLADRVRRWRARRRPIAA